MIPLEERKPDPKAKKMKNRYEEACKKASVKSGGEGLSQGAQDLIEGFRRLRVQSAANAHNVYVR